MLFGAALLGLVHLSAASFAFKAQVGNDYTIGSRDANLEPIGLAGRLARAQANFIRPISRRPFRFSWPASSLFMPPGPSALSVIGVVRSTWAARYCSCRYIWPA